MVMEMHLSKEQLSVQTAQQWRGKWFSAQTQKLPSLLQKLLMQQLLRTAQVRRACIQICLQLREPNL